MKPMRTLLCAVCLVVMLACMPTALLPGGRIEGSGQISSTTRSIGNAARVNLQGSGDVTVVIGDQPSVVIETDDNLLPYLITSVRGGTLTLRTKLGTDVVPTDRIRYTVTLRTLDGITMDGSGNITAAGVQGPSLTIRMPGSGNITVTGAVDSLDVRMNGSGNILCGDLQATAATVRLPGSGEITVWATSSINASLAGSGNIRYYGDPGQVNVSQPGSGNISSLGSRN